MFYAKLRFFSQLHNKTLPFFATSEKLSTFVRKFFSTSNIIEHDLEREH